MIGSRYIIIPIILFAFSLRPSLFWVKLIPLIQPKIYYGDKGWHLETPNGNYATDLQLRLQLRYSYPFEQDPTSLEDLNKEQQHILQIRRARVKIGGHAFTPKLKYYMEYELAGFKSPGFLGHLFF